MLREIIEKKIPLRHAPKSGHLVVVEANHKSRDEIEFLSKIGQRPKSFNLPDYAANAEQTRNLPEHGQAVHITAES